MGLFVDGACLESAVQRLSDRYFGCAFELDYRKLLTGQLGAVDKVFYYDALPIFDRGETDDAWQKRTAAKRAILEHIESLDRFEVFEGDVRRIRPEDPHCKVPHMGWNSLEGALPTEMFAGLGPSPHMYFTHSFAIYPDWADDIAASTDHGGRFAAAVMRGNVAGVQFHPEKSQAAGARLLANMLEWRP